MKNKLKLSILITTMDSGINRVKKEILPQLQGVDEVVISHQITNKDILPEKTKMGKNVVYTYLYGKGLSKNRNNALMHASGDICYICDDDLNFKLGFELIIKNAYKKIGADVITFQAEDEEGNLHFDIKRGNHSLFSLLKIWSLGITFKRKVLLDNKISFDEDFGLGTKYPVGEENLFLFTSWKQGLSLYHFNQTIVIHPRESSGVQYRDELIIARIKLFKKMFGLLGGIAAIFYFTILHYKFYKKKYSFWSFFSLSCKSLF